MPLPTALTPVARAVRRALFLTLAGAASCALAQQTPPWRCSDAAIATFECEVVTGTLNISGRSIAARNAAHPPGPAIELRELGRVRNFGEAWIRDAGYPIVFNPSFPGIRTYRLENGGELTFPTLHFINENRDAAQVLSLSAINHGDGTMRVHGPAHAAAPAHGWVLLDTLTLMSGSRLFIEPGARLSLGETFLQPGVLLDQRGHLAVSGRFFASGYDLDFRHGDLTLGGTLWTASSTRVASLEVLAGTEIGGSLRVDGSTLIDFANDPTGLQVMTLGRDDAPTDFHHLWLKSGLLRVQGQAPVRVSGDLRVGHGGFFGGMAQSLRMDTPDPADRGSFAALSFEPGANFGTALELRRNTQVSGLLPSGIVNHATMRIEAPDADTASAALRPDGFRNEGTVEVTRGWLRLVGNGDLGGELLLRTGAGLQWVGEAGVTDTASIERLSAWTGAATPAQASIWRQARLQLEDITLRLPGASSQLLNEGRLQFGGDAALLAQSAAGAREVNYIRNDGVFIQDRSSLMLQRLDNLTRGQALWRDAGANPATDAQHVWELANQGRVTVESGRLVAFWLISDSAPAQGAAFGYADGRLFGDGAFEVGDGAVLQVLRGLGPVEVLDARVELRGSAQLLHDGAFQFNPALGLPVLDGLRHIEPRGMFRLLDGASFIQPGAIGLLNEGWLEVGTGSTMILSGILVQRAGRLQVDGDLWGNVQLEGGAMTGNGTHHGRLVQNAPMGPGNSIGALQVVGALEMTENAVLQIELDASGVDPLPAALPWLAGLQQADLLRVEGEALLGGVLEIDASGSGAFLAPVSLPFLAVSGPLAGAFSDVRLLGTAGRLEQIHLRFEWNPADGYTLGWLDITPVPEPAPALLLALGLAALALRRRSLQQHGQ